MVVSDVVSSLGGVSWIESTDDSVDVSTDCIESDDVKPSDDCPDSVADSVASLTEVGCEEST